MPPRGGGAADDDSYESLGDHGGGGGGSDAHIAAGRRRAAAARVTLDDILHFVFPAHLQHPLSSGRLLVYGYYGPPSAAAGGRIMSGQKGLHAVGDWELDAMCAAMDREDRLQVYIRDDRPLCALSAAQQQDVLAQSTIRFPQVTREQVAALLAPLPRDDAHTLSFHDVQRAIVKYREARVADGKVMYPSLTGSGVTKRLAASAAATARATSRSTATLAAAPGGRGAAAAAGRARGGRYKFSPDIAPASMFLRDRGMGDMEMAAHINKLLSTRCFKISSIDHGSSPELTQNVRLLRDDDASACRAPPSAARRGRWSETCCYTAGKHAK